MENLFHFTGIIVWSLITLLVALFIIAIIWYKIIKHSIVSHWISCMYTQLTVNYNTPIHPLAFEALKVRLKSLQDNKCRLFEQKFLTKYLSKCKVKEMETVFDN